MAINLTVPVARELKPRIVVFGIGGAGGNAVNNMINSQLPGVEFVVGNTDAQALSSSLAEQRLQLGVSVTQGLGAGARPDVGRAAAEEAMDQIADHLQGCHMAFITAGMGGGTGTGAAPVVARIAREMGVLTIGVVTKPFQFEGNHRMRIAEAGIEDLGQYVDTLIIIPNQNLFRVVTEKTTFADAFRMADNVLHAGVRGITDLMVMPGLINLDFADVRTVMNEMGKAMMGTGEAEGSNRATAAAEAAIANPLLDDVCMKGAKGVLINITGGGDLTLFEVDEAANRIRSEVDPEANIIVGSTFDEGLAGRMRVSVVATGIEAAAGSVQPPVSNGVVTPFVRPDAARQTGTASPAPAAFRAEAEPRRGGGVGGMAALATSPSPVSAPSAVHAPVAQAAGPLSRAESVAKADSLARAEGALRPEPQPRFQPALPAAAVQAQPQAQPQAQASQGQPEAQDAPFIPPRRPGVQAQTEMAAPDPFREAEIVNGPSEERENRRPGLFERFARSTTRARGVSEAPAAPRAEPRMPRPAPAQTQAPSAPSLSGLEASERPSTPQREEDLLDIPAFLRRQAN